MRVRSPAALLAVLLLAGCGLPLESGVRQPGQVSSEQVQEEGGVQFLPPPPQPGASPADIVAGFLGAQKNADDRHAIARQYLSPEIRDTWDDRATVAVYEADSLDVDEVGEGAFQVTADVTARIAEDGSYRPEVDDRLDEVFRLTRDGSGQVRLAEVPAGLQLTSGEVDESFRPRDVYYLSSAGSDTQDSRVVADRVFLPVIPDLADALVRRLLAGPSAPLAGAVVTAVPEGTTLLRPVDVQDGVVTVDLSAPVEALDSLERRRLSAQLVWTLKEAGPAFTSLRLLVDGRPLEVDGVGELQDRSAWAGFDPDGRSGAVSPLFVQDRRLRSLTGRVRVSEATDGRLPIDVVALSPSSGELALLTRLDAGGGDQLRIGPPQGPFGEPVLAGPGLASPSWGSGERGLWVLEPGSGDNPSRVLLVRADRSVQQVPYTAPTGAGPLTVLRVSRDGVRVAMVFGEGEQRRLWVGKIEIGPTGPQVTFLRSVAPGLADVSDVAWAGGTSLVVLAPLGTTNRLPVRVVVDGSLIEPVGALGLNGEATSLAAAPERPLVVATSVDGAAELLVEEGGLLQRRASGGAPAYPG